VALSALQRWIGLPTLTLYRLLSWAILAAGVAILVLAVALRYWVLPNVGNYREDIEAALTKAAGQRVTIGRISGSWHGFRPELVLGEVVVLDRSGRPALRLERIENTLSWQTLLVPGSATGCCARTKSWCGTLPSRGTTSCAGRHRLR
jgi:uncharacterized protein YhdP